MIQDYKSQIDLLQSLLKTFANKWSGAMRMQQKTNLSSKKCNCLHF
jgi:hypothetical protein